MHYYEFEFSINYFLNIIFIIFISTLLDNLFFLGLKMTETLKSLTVKIILCKKPGFKLLNCYYQIY